MFPALALLHEGLVTTAHLFYLHLKLSADNKHVTLHITAGGSVHVRHTCLLQLSQLVVRRLAVPRAGVNSILSIPIHCNSFYSIPIHFFSIPIKFLSIHFFPIPITFLSIIFFFNSNSFNSIFSIPFFQFQFIAIHFIQFQFIFLNSN